MNDANTGFDQQIEDLMAAMTVREKLGQCVMIEPCFCLAERTSEAFGDDYQDECDPAYLSMLLDDYNIGMFLFGGASRIGDGSARAWAEYIALLTEHAAGTRHKIPLMFGIDAVHGVNFMKGSTIFSHNLGTTATWNPRLVERYAQGVGAELLSIGFNCNFAPSVDVARDTRWGRVYESLGEDPYLAAQIGGALISGLQSNDGLAACAKHFIGYGESSNGMDRTQADLSRRSILEMHAPPFQEAIARGLLTLMVSGGDVNGVPVPVSKRLLTDLLRDSLGFEGITMSDWEDVERLYSRHKIATDRKEAIIRAFNAGLDVNMAVSNIAAVDDMEAAVAEGSISMERLDQAVRNILLTKFKLGLFSREPVNVARAGALVGSDESRSVAGQIALQSMTLLKNRDDILPLSRGVKSILVTGKAAASKRHLCGGWTLGWAGADEDDLQCQTILDALREIVSPNTRITHVDDASQLQGMDMSEHDFEVCISVVSEEPHAEWYGDSMELGLEPDENEMLRAAVATGIPVVMVAVLGRPLNVTWAEANVAAMLWTFLPGTEGAGPIAQILFGEANPSAKLPISFPLDGSHVPALYNARSYESEEINTWYEPLFEFGYGLSYTQFAYSNLSVPEVVEAGETVEVSVSVQNTGKMDGCEIVQLYLRDIVASVTRPLKSLKAFERVHLKAGESKTVTLSLGPDELSLYDEDLEFVEEPRRIRVLVGDQARELRIAPKA